jgi:hypothetical protein
MILITQAQRSFKITPIGILQVIVECHGYCL